MKIAIVGSGISGLGAAWALSRSHDVTLFEAADRLGGHANTVEVETGDQRIAVDTGFIVYNEKNYPNLTRLFAHLGVPTEDSNMSFAYSADGGRFEYAGSAGGLFAQRRNLVRPRMWRMTRDLLRFYREAPGFLDAPEPGLTLQGYLRRNGYSRAFVQDHLLPMAAAIWSAPLSEILAFPAESFLRFLDNHGLLLFDGRPHWRTVSGGSREYVRRIAGAIDGQIRLGTPVAGLRRTPAGVMLRDAGGGESRFDQVVLACHGDRALSILGQQATAPERELLGAFRYQANRAILHRDPALMPRRRSVWSSWNYMAGRWTGEDAPISVTYWMNRLQNLDSGVPLFVSLNPLREPDPAAVFASFDYDHPVFDQAAITAQRCLPAIQGVNRTWFCGSYCGYGFHEDGLQAGLAVAAALGSAAPWADEIVPASPAADVATPLPAVAAAAE